VILNKIQPFVIGITGLSGSGKTFYVNLLKEKLGNNISIVGFDDYYKSLDQQIMDENGEINYDLPSALHQDKFHADLLKLIDYQTVEIKKYQFENYHTPEIIEVIKPAPILVVEGLFVLDYQPVNNLLNFRIFMDCNLELCFNRRLSRDVSQRNIPENKSKYQWKHHVLPAFEKYIVPHKDSCNMVIENNGTPEENIDAIIEKIKSMAHPSVIHKLPK
jgi:uridine kinase